MSAEAEVIVGLNRVAHWLNNSGRIICDNSAAELIGVRYNSIEEARSAVPNLTICERCKTQRVKPVAIFRATAGRPKGSRRCIQCNTIIPHSARWCPNCGAQDTPD